MNRSTTGILFLEIMHMWIRTRMPDIQYHMPAMWKFQKFQKFQKSLEKSWYPADWVICFWELRPLIRVHKKHSVIQNWSLVYITLISLSLYFRTIPFSRLVLHINDYSTISHWFIGFHWFILTWRKDRWYRFRAKLSGIIFSNPKNRISKAV